MYLLENFFHAISFYPQCQYKISYKIPYTVTYSTGAGGGIAPEGAGVNGGSSVALPEQGSMTGPEGAVLTGWNDGAVTYPMGVSYTVNGNVTLTAQWGALASMEAVAAHLASPPEGQAGTKTVSIFLPVELALADGTNGWAALLSAIQAADKYVALDLSTSTITGMTGTTGRFAPGTADTGERYITALVLPDTATSIKAGSSSSLLHLWIFAPSVTQKSRLSGMLSEFAG
jgi:hypothetical protein